MHVVAEHVYEVLHGDDRLKWNCYAEGLLPVHRLQFLALLGDDLAVVVAFREEHLGCDAVCRRIILLREFRLRHRHPDERLLGVFHVFNLDSRLLLESAVL